MWHKVNFNSQNIEHHTAKSILIKMPNRSKYAGYTFWHPSKLVRGADWKRSFSFNDDWEFTIFKTGKNYKRTIEKKLGAEEMLEAFEIVNEELTPTDNDESYLKVTEPEPINADVIIPDELKREEI